MLAIQHGKTNKENIIFSFSFPRLLLLLLLPFSRSPPFLPNMATRNQGGSIDVKALQDAFPSVDFSLSQKGNQATLSKVVVPKDQRGQGVGSEFMNALQKQQIQTVHSLRYRPRLILAATKQN